MKGYQVYACGDHGLTIELGNEINVHTHQQVMALYRHIIQGRMPGIRDVLPAYTSVTVLYDVAEIKKRTSLSAYQYMYRFAEERVGSCSWGVETAATHVNIPVCYNVALAPDIERMAREKNLSVEEIIHIHSSAEYQVYMIGFLPGFAYMGSVHERIATARLARPRPAVEAGSVGIAGLQTGIYPLNTPGGWNIIGQTPVQMFDATLKKTCYVQAGDTVRFIPIGLEEFIHLKTLA